ncbi:hypothetical protein [Methanovulcanius yangii]|nr:hypothetical protein [Methanovulcanius yangii]
MKITGQYRANIRLVGAQEKRDGEEDEKKSVRWKEEELAIVAFFN